MPKPDFNPIGAYVGMLLGAILAPITVLAAWTWFLPPDGQTGMAFCMLSPFSVLGGGCGGYFLGTGLDRLRDSRHAMPRWQRRVLVLVAASLELVIFVVLVACGSLAMVRAR